MGPKIVTILFAVQLLAYIANAGPITLDITKCGATPNGDITQVLLKLWSEACASGVSSKIVIPRGTWKLGQVELVGPNKAPIELKVEGTLVAPQGSLPNKDNDWITITNLNNFEISGGGIFDGQGQQAWKTNDCAKNTQCQALPVNLSFCGINNTIIHSVTSKDSKYFHVNLINSHNVTFSKFSISAPGDSPNTDGLHLARSSNIHVSDSIIQTGDDCISIGDDSKDYHISKVTCGPGHGISIGSLGKYENEKDVTGIHIKDCTFKGTTNGVRIKSWPSTPYKLQASDLHFENLIMDNVSQPIIIDQEYCPWNQCSLKAPSLVKISDVFIENVKGTSFTQDAVIFACSKAYSCQNVHVGNINLKYTGKLGPTTTKCSNVNPIVKGSMHPPLCVASSAKSH